jgi:hypothetical protein
LCRKSNVFRTSPQITRRYRAERLDIQPRITVYDAPLCSYFDWDESLPGTRQLASRKSPPTAGDKPRVFCRHTKCRAKLPEPADNPRRAFCTRGCHSAFYRSRCIVCEEPIERQTERQRICGRSRCRAELRRFPHLFVFPVKMGRGSRNGFNRARNAHSTGFKTALLPGATRRIYGPRRVIAAECFARNWQQVVSSDGVPIEVARLRPRALQDSSGRAAQPHTSAQSRIAAAIGRACRTRRHPAPAVTIAYGVGVAV